VHGRCWMLDRRQMLDRSSTATTTRPSAAVLVTTENRYARASPSDDRYRAALGLALARLVAAADATFDFLQQRQWCCVRLVSVCVCVYYYFPLQGDSPVPRGGKRAPLARMHSKLQDQPPTTPCAYLYLASPAYKPLNLVGRAHAHRGNCRLQETPSCSWGGGVGGSRSTHPLPPPKPMHRTSATHP
jgi:hypothetical protein